MGRKDYASINLEALFSVELNIVVDITIYLNTKRKCFVLCNNLNILS